MFCTFGLCGDNEFLWCCCLLYAVLVFYLVAISSFVWPLSFLCSLFVFHVAWGRFKYLRFWDFKLDFFSIRSIRNIFLLNNFLLHSPFDNVPFFLESCLLGLIRSINYKFSRCSPLSMYGRPYGQTKLSSRLEYEDVSFVWYCSCVSNKILYTFCTNNQNLLN